MIVFPTPVQTTLLFYMNYRYLKDKVAGHLMFVLSALSLLLVVSMGVGLYLKSAPILADHSLWSLISASEWKPMKNEFGFFPFIMGTAWVTVLAVAFALPISLLMAVFLTEALRISSARYSRRSSLCHLQRMGDSADCPVDFGVRRSFSLALL